MSPSRNVLSLLVSCAFLFAIGCGGTAPEELATAPAEPSNVESLSACTARCVGSESISCSGSTCQAVDNQYVTCDGRRTNCPSAPSSCTATVYCESLGGALSCTGSSCQEQGPQSTKVCGGVTCNGVTQWCPPLPGDLECF
jgi:hypothetical protein